MSLQTSLSKGRSGRWFRRGGNIVIDLGGRDQEQELEVSPTATKPFWQRVIHRRIDVDAQRALISMQASGNPSDVMDATTLVNAIDVPTPLVGPVLGIYKQNQQDPVTYFQHSRYKYWWNPEIMRGRKSTFECFMRGTMMIVLRLNLTQEEIKVELRRAALTVRTGSLCP